MKADIILKSNKIRFVAFSISLGSTKCGCFHISWLNFYQKMIKKNIYEYSKCSDYKSEENNIRNFGQGRKKGT